MRGFSAELLIQIPRSQWVKMLKQLRAIQI